MPLPDDPGVMLTPPIRQGQISPRMFREIKEGRRPFNTLGAAIALFLVVAVFGAILAAALLVIPTKAAAAEFTITCSDVPTRNVHYSVDYRAFWIFNEGVPAELPTRYGGRLPDETIKVTDAIPSPDGAYWLCGRSDGKRRWFFAPPMRPAS